MIRGEHDGHLATQRCVGFDRRQQACQHAIGVGHALAIGRAVGKIPAAGMTREVGRWQVQEGDAALALQGRIAKERERVVRLTHGARVTHEQIQLVAAVVGHKRVRTARILAVGLLEQHELPLAADECGAQALIVRDIEHAAHVSVIARMQRAAMLARRRIVIGDPSMPGVAGHGAAGDHVDVVRQRDRDLRIASRLQRVRTTRQARQGRIAGGDRGGDALGSQPIHGHHHHMLDARRGFTHADGEQREHDDAEKS